VNCDRCDAESRALVEGVWSGRPHWLCSKCVTEEWLKLGCCAAAEWGRVRVLRIVELPVPVTTWMNLTLWPTPWPV
jgi:hypothetical protein